jgi:hypothetical protein
MAEPVDYRNHGYTVSISTGSGNPSREMSITHESTLEYERLFFRHKENRWAACRNGETTFLSVTHEFVAVIPLRKCDLMTGN